MRGTALTLFCLMLAGCSATEGEEEEVGKVLSQEQKDVCLRHCDGTYPEHTYPSVSDERRACGYTFLKLSLSHSLSLSPPLLPSSPPHSPKITWHAPEGVGWHRSML